MAHRPEPDQGRDGEGPPHDFLALTHDLRQCIMASLLLTELPSAYPLDRETRRRLDLLHRTLDYARAILEQAKAEGPPEHRLVDLADLAEQSAIVTQYRHQVRVVDETGGRGMVCGEPVLLQRAIENMVDNAGRAAGEDGGVVVRVGASDDEAWLEVVDDGPGFGRIEHGTGHGLSLVSSAVQDCSGRLQITSGPGPGTAVRMTLPRRPASPGDGPASRHC